MNEVRWLRSLNTRDASHGSIDVTSGVMEQVRSRSQQHDEDRVMPVAAAIAVALGIAATLFALPSWGTSADPFRGFGEVVNLVLR